MGVAFKNCSKQQAVACCTCPPIRQTTTELRSVGLGSKVGFANIYLTAVPYEQQWSLFSKMLRPNTAGDRYTTARLRRTFLENCSPHSPPSTVTPEGVTSKLKA